MDRAYLLALALTAAAAPALAASALQEETPKLPPALGTSRAEGASMLASDGDAAAPGRVPRDTTEGARLLWSRLAGSLSVDDGTPAGEAPRAFQFEFDVRSRQPSGTQNFSARFHYLDEGPGLVRGVVLDQQRAERSTQMRGRDERGRLQYWYRKVQGEGQTDGWQSLRGRDAKESRAEIDSWAAISFDIARLTRPSSFRIISLRERTMTREEGAPLQLRFDGDPHPVVLPGTDIEGVRGGRKQAISELCAGLQWLELQTPDFRDFRSVEGAEARSRPYRLLFGIAPDSGRPQVVLVSPGSSGPLQVPGAVLVQSTEWLLHPQAGAPKDQSWLPGRFFAYETTTGASPSELRFSDVPRADLYFIDGDMSADLDAAFFRPR